MFLLIDYRSYYLIFQISKSIEIICEENIQEYNKIWHLNETERQIYEDVIIR